MCQRVSVLSFLFCAFIFHPLVQCTLTVPKCCPASGYELTSDIYGEHNRDHSSLLSCTTILQQNTSDPEIGTHYGLDSDIPPTLPNCGRYRLFSLLESDAPVALPLRSSCVDLVNQTYKAVMCSEDSLVPPDKDFIKVYTVRKCCPVNSIYDEEILSCREIKSTFQSVPLSPFWKDDTKDIQLLKSLINGFNTSENSIGEPLFHLGYPECSDQEVLVSYQIKREEFNLQQNRIIPKSMFGDRNLNVFITQSTDPFCIDSVAPSTANPPITESDASNITWIVRVCRPKSICDSIPCIRKCCGPNEMMSKRGNQTVCVRYGKDLKMQFHKIEGQCFPEDPEKVHNPEYGIAHQQSCARYILEEDISTDRHFFNGENGHLHMDKTIPIHHNEYCVDYVDRGVDVVLQKTFVCFTEGPTDTGFFVYAVGLCISCVFLGATLIVYACLPKLLNLHGKTLVSHVSALLVAYGGLAYIQFGITVQPRFCYAVALFTYGAFLAAFSWLNVMCFDIWWTFGSVRQSRGMRKTRDTKRFIGYSVYAWGIPTILTTFVHLVDKYTLLHSDYLPNMGKRSCWFASENGPAHRLFFLLPMGIIISMNVNFFVLTAVHCNRVKSEIHRMQTSDDSKDSHKKRFFADKARMVMNLKLFCVMGISWLMELIASIYTEPQIVWYITDSVNVLQGLFVFLIFVFKRNVLTAIKKRLGMATRATRGGVTMLGVTTAGGTTTTSLMGSNNQVCLDPYSKYKMTKSCSQSTVLSGIHRQRSA